VGGHLTALRRTRSGAFTLADAVALGALAERWEVLPLDEVARRCFPTQRVDPEQAAMVRHGRALSRLRLPDPGPVALLDDAGEFLALYEQHGPVARAVAVFAD
jgi:tRNA pseudouridine55 synthase